MSIEGLGIPLMKRTQEAQNHFWQYLAEADWRPTQALTYGKRQALRTVLYRAARRPGF